MKKKAWLILIPVVSSAVVVAQESVVDSVHNLSATGPGSIRAPGEQQVCIFCHTPHRAATAPALWNRQEPLLPYTVYDSTALDAEPSQPTGSSKMCLSCHDGSIALGSVVSRDQVIRMAGSITTLPPGTSNLGTDLSDDHPISFAYDFALAGKDARLANPHALPSALRLSPSGELQCTTCHDPHDNSFGDFLVMDNTDSRLCMSCHRISETTIAAHMDCSACHQSHSAPSGPFLLVEQQVTETCLTCHDGSQVAAGNILADLGKVSVHDTNRPVDPEDRTAHSACTDCHEPHTMMIGPPPTAPDAAANLGDLSAREPGASYSAEYDVCFKCHGDYDTTNTWPVISRQIGRMTMRQQFDPGAPSYHPVMAPGRSTNSPSLRPGWTEGSLVLCSDCHGSDSSRKAGGSGPNGVHGSIYPSLLLARYDTTDYTPESEQAYALCYRCHKRDGVGGILSDASFPHRVHVVDGRASCSACHDPHGISSAQGTRRNNSHLINFDTSVVFPDPITGRMEFVDQGSFTGSCTLSCHGVSHSPLDY